MENTYARAYSEVLEILNFIPMQEYEKISNEEINYLKNNSDKNYKFSFDVSIPFEQQKILPETRSIILVLYSKYFLNEKQNAKLEEFIKNTTLQKENEIREQYNPDVFKNNENQPTLTNSNNQTNLKMFVNSNDQINQPTLANSNSQINQSNSVSMIKYKENIFKKIWNKFKNIFKKSHLQK